MIAKHRWFSAAVVATLAIGIGINSTIFTLVDAVLYKPVGVPGGERLVVVSGFQLDNPSENSPVAWLDFVEFRDHNTSFAALNAIENGQGVIGEAGIPPERYSLARITPGMFGMIQTPVVLGRGFTPADGEPGAEPVMLIGYQIWQQRYGGAADAIGRSVRLNGSPTTIVGVMPQGVRFPNNRDLWVPLVPTAAHEDRGSRTLFLCGMLKPGVSPEAAMSDLSVIATRLRTEFAETNENRGVRVGTFHEFFNGGPIRVVFLMMLGAVGFVLLIACANVANMMLARGVARGREIAVRAAVGASRGRLVRQLLVESVLLSAIGGAAGLGIALFGLRAFDLATQNVGRPYWIDFSMDWRAATYFVLISLASGVIFGLLPALRASRVDLNTAIKTGTPGSGTDKGRLTGSLVVLQFALTVVLLAGAGAMIRSFFAVREINAFTQPESLFTARVQLPEQDGERYKEPESRRQFTEAALADMRNLPGVTAAAVASTAPGMQGSSRSVQIDGRPAPTPELPESGSMVVTTPGYLETARLPLLLGRTFNELDGEPGREAAIVSLAFAERYWPGEDAIGKRFRLSPQPDADEAWMTVVGVSANLDADPNSPEAPPTFYITYEQKPWGWMTFLLRTTGDASVLATPVRQVVQRHDAELPMFDVRTLAAGIEQETWFLKVFGTVFSVFAVSGLVMAGVGIYGVIAHHTARRTREIGIRMALGATTANIARLVVSRGMWQLGLGLALGLGGAFAAVKLMASAGLLVAVTATDPTLFVGVVGLLLMVGLSACWLPARRATRVAPTEALRTE